MMIFSHIFYFFVSPAALSEDVDFFANEQSNVLAPGVILADLLLVTFDNNILVIEKNF